MQIANLLFRLDAQRLRNTLRLYKTDRKKQQRLLMFAVSIGLFLWYYIFRPVSAKRSGILEHWNIWRYAFPYAFAIGASLFGAYGRISRWLGRWSSRSWSVLPLEPRPIAQWLLGSMLLWDSIEIVLGIIVSIGLAYILKLNWLQEFPFLLLGTTLLVAVVSISKTLASLLLRYGGGRILHWPNWVLKWLSSLLAMLFLQPLAAFWWIAEFSRQRGNPGIALIALLILTAGTAVLMWCAHELIVRYWSDIAASFELQQTQRKAKNRVPLANFLANRFRSPVTRMVTLYNLRSRNQQVGWSGSKITIGGRRLHMLVFIFCCMCLLFFGPMFLTLADSAGEESQAMMIALFCGSWVCVYTIALIPSMFPAYRLVRLMPVPFHKWVWALAVLPCFTAGFFLISTGIFLFIYEPTTAVQWIAVMVGLFLSVASLRIFALSAFPGTTQQTSEILFFAILGIGALLYFTLTWIAVIPWILGANIYFMLKAARVWRYREEGLHA
jgi:hypothetical protein